MAKRALLIGASAAKLRGVEANIVLMHDVLEAYGFEFDERPVPPTRHAIIRALLDLVTTAAKDDTIVIYFCGHGGLARFKGDIAGLGPINRVWRYLVPLDDLHSHTNDRFHGILDVELGHILGRQLAARCANVTLILECCYAGGMIAGSECAKAGATVDVKFFSVPDSLRGPQPWATRGLAHDRMTQDAEPRELVVIAATVEARKAYESAEPPYHGYFTKALADQLRRYHGRSVTWGRVIDEVKRQVQCSRDMLDQQPHVIGPRGRVVFGGETHDVSREFEVMAGIDGGLQVFAGRLHGFEDGDQFEWLDDGGGSLGLGTLRDTGPTRASLILAGDRAPIKPGMMSVCVLRARAKRTPIRVCGDSPTLFELRGAVATSAWLRVANDEEDALAEVCIDRGRLLVTGPALARSPSPIEPREDLAGDRDSPTPAVLADLEAVARAQVFVAYCSNLPPPPAGVEFWLSVDGAEGRRMLGVEGGIVELSEPVNAGMKYTQKWVETLFVNLLNQGLDGQLTVVSKNNRGGFNLFAEGDDATGQERRLRWPDDVPRRPTREALWFVVTSEEVDLTSLLMQKSIRSGHTRGIVDRLLGPVDAYAHRIEFTVRP